MIQQHVCIQIEQNLKIKMYVYKHIYVNNRYIHIQNVSIH